MALRSGRIVTNLGSNSSKILGLSTSQRFLSTTSSVNSASQRPKIKIVEVGPRDGLQNEKNIISVETKVALIDRLVRAGIRSIETGSYVSPKWVPRMAGTEDVMKSQELRTLRKELGSSVEFPVLVPNLKGLQGVEATMNDPASEGTIDEIAIFAAATDEFSKANLNTTVNESIDRLAPVVENARKLGLRVRGYISVAVVCPFAGRVDPNVVSDLTDKFIKMGCYEVSIADTVGVATPTDMETCFNVVAKRTPLSKVAAHCHDTYGTAVANVLAMAKMGVPTIDAAVGGLGGCPYSPGATGNVATEDVVYALEGEGFDTGLLEPTQPSYTDLAKANEFDLTRATSLEKLAEIGQWISDELARPNSSRVGKAILARKQRLASKSS